ncbi:hypothetical protein CALVIDRAFT_564823 [Calocera viscosa TUFC12733]|uniref:Amino acid transporter transmembrane domain-containing protein n=1 Tax=Calocera viscosa (strain TUFC12733) TaxID=1330018 RepID=A0A167L7R0_CALVF|nr:hypothetical protein CALVIDRAFT_564823 [Calocera viscosa TUFC12733]
MSIAAPGALSVEDAGNPKIFTDEKKEHDLLEPAHVAYGSRKPRFEDFVFYAQVQRESEHDDLSVEVGQKFGPLGLWRRRNTVALGPTETEKEKDGIATSPVDYDIQTEGLTEHERDRVDAWRALRLTSWAGAFYLCTTDILGPFNAPYAFRVNGYVPGVFLYFFMGCLAFYGGGMLWYLYVKLDSARFPVKSYADIAERVAGPYFRTFVTFLIFVHMIVNVGNTCLGNAQALSQMAKGNICFIVAVVVWTLVGMVIGQIRTLKAYGWLANMAVWLNYLLIFLSMGFIAHSEPNYSSAKAAYGIAAGPVIKQTFSNYPIYERVNGIMNIVYAYGGATIFPQIIAEMRRPMDFLKAMSIAQVVIMTAYMMYGLFVYSFQGQFTLPLAYQGVANYPLQTVANVISLVSGIIAGGLYGNIGLKVAYVNIVEDILHGPPLNSRTGRITWTISVIVFWTVGFVIGTAIPQIQNLSGMVGATTNVHFTYSFPTGFYFIYSVMSAAAAGDPAYVPGQENKRVDTWREWSRWKRGLTGGSRKEVLFRYFNGTLCLAALALGGIGIYGSAVSIRASFVAGSPTSFSCAAPV